MLCRRIISTCRVSSLYLSPINKFNIQNYCTTKNNNNNSSLKEILQKDERYRISKDEYFKLADKTGISKEDAEIQLTKLQKENIIMEIPSVEKYIFIHPERVTNHLLQVLDPSNALTEEKIKINHKTLDNYLEKKNDLDHKRLEIEKQAEASTSRVLWGLAGGFIVQGVAIARLTWWDLSWDIMEPVTYLLTFGSSIIFLAYFQAYRLDFSYKVMKDRLHQKKRLKFFKKNGFDIESYEKLCHQIKVVQNDLLVLGEPIAKIPQFPLQHEPLHIDLPKPQYE